jgi:hypothetical protein
MTRTRKASPEDQVHAALKASIEVETKGSLWGGSATFVPYVSDTVWGDGRSLLLLQPLNTRPCYYVVRIDSTWRVEGDRDWPDGAPEVWDFIDEIEVELESEFGEACESDEDDPDEELPRPWPAFNGNSGCGWDRMEWPSDRGFALDSHPFHERYDVLSDVRESAIVVRQYQPITARVAIETLLAAKGGAS